MNDKTSFNLLSVMFFNINFFRANIPKLLIGGRSFVFDFGYEDGSNLIIKTCDDYINKQVIYFNTNMMRVDSMTQYSEKGLDIRLPDFIHRTVIPRKAHSDFDTCKMFNQFNLYVHYIMFSFNYMYWR